MKTASGWFEVDKTGLAKLVERRGKAFVLYELLQNDKTKMASMKKREEADKTRLRAAVTELADT